MANTLQDSGTEYIYNLQVPYWGQMTFDSNMDGMPSESDILALASFLQSQGFTVTLDKVTGTQKILHVDLSVDPPTFDEPA